jgi:hypothetical protein
LQDIDISSIIDEPVISSENFNLNIQGVDISSIISDSLDKGVNIATIINDFYDKGIDMESGTDINISSIINDSNDEIFKFTYLMLASVSGCPSIVDYLIAQKAQTWPKSFDLNYSQWRNKSNVHNNESIPENTLYRNRSVTSEIKYNKIKNSWFTNLNSKKDFYIKDLANIYFEMMTPYIPNAKDTNEIKTMMDTEHWNYKLLASKFNLLNALCLSNKNYPYKDIIQTFVYELIDKI